MSGPGILESHFIPIAIGATAVVAGGLVLHYYINKKYRRPSRPIPRGEPNLTARLRVLVDETDKYQLPLVEKWEINHDTRRFRLALPSTQHILGLNVGQHILLTAKIGNETIVRPYTPVTSDDDLGYVDLIIKIYFKDEHSSFPAGGKMTQYLENMEIGDMIGCSGPIGPSYELKFGKFWFKKSPKDPSPSIMSVKYVNMIAGGTGITPMLQLILHVLKDRENDRTKLALLYANKTEADILLRKKLDELAEKYPGIFKVWYTVDWPPEEWAYSHGFVNDEMIKSHLYPSSDWTITFLCGPKPMIDLACLPALDKLGYDPELRFIY